MSRTEITTALLLCTALVSNAGAVCCPVFPPQWQMRSTGQTNFVNVDNGTITLIPNVVFRGDAPDFALLVPTPTVPMLTPMSDLLWEELSALTRPRGRTRTSWSEGCGTTDAIPLAGGIDEATDDGIDIIDRQTVGRFEATILRADGTESLITWLDANGYGYSVDDATAFTTYIDRDWVFTAMRLDPADPLNDVPTDGWDHTVDPVAFSYEAADFEVALPITAIHREERLPMRFYVVADARMTLEGFTTNYANRLSADEASVIAARNTEVPRWAKASKFLVRLDRTFSPTDPMADSIVLRRAASQDEVAPGFNGPIGSAIPLGLLPWLLVFAWSRRRRK